VGGQCGLALHQWFMFLSCQQTGLALHTIICSVPREDKLAAYRPRMPCVSLGVSAQRSLDIGIENYGSGWYGYYFAGEDPAGKNQKAYNKAYVGANGKYTPPMHTDATSASIQVSSRSSASASQLLPFRRDLAR